jgi:DNA-binding transcriptional ArsR family regulator
MGHKTVGADATVAGLEGSGPGQAASSVPPAVLDAASAAMVAQTLQALAAPSRLLILSRLRRGPCSVSQLAADIGMEQSAVSHQLRLLRHLGLVEGTRHGKATVYALYDDHVARLLDEAVYHSEHLRLGLSDQAQAARLLSAPGVARQ